MDRDSSRPKNEDALGSSHSLAASLTAPAISFSNPATGEALGKLWFEDGEFRFKGDLSESAQKFFNFMRDSGMLGSRFGEEIAFFLGKTEQWENIGLTGRWIAVRKLKDGSFNWKAFGEDYSSIRNDAYFPVDGKTLFRQLGAPPAQFGLATEVLPTVTEIKDCQAVNTLSPHQALCDHYWYEPASTFPRVYRCANCNLERPASVPGQR